VCICLYLSGRGVGGRWCFDGDGFSPILAQANTVGVPHHGGGYGSRSPYVVWRSDVQHVQLLSCT
jgi:hypothetical protein